MSQRPRIRGWRSRLLVPAAGVMVLAGSPGQAGALAGAEPPAGSVTGWVRHNAVPLDTIDPAAPLDDQAPLRRSIGDAAIVGLGESFHGAAEEIQLKHRALRLLVERMGFRSIAWEEDWTTGRQIDQYIQTGRGDLDALMREVSPQYQSRQVADVLRWLRDYNAGRADKVRFVGIEYYFTPRPAYDAVKAHVAETAPHRLPELESHLEVIRPPDDMNKFQYAQWYAEQAEDKERYIRHARQTYELVRSLPHRPGDRAHALIVRQARQIVSFYEHYSLPEDDRHAYRDAHAARNLKWWRSFTDDKIAYWSASPHVADAPRVRLAGPPPEPDIRFASVGSFLRRWYDRRYRPISFTFDHGTTIIGPGQTAPLPPPEPGWFERPFGKVRADQFVLDLRAPAPPPVRRWLRSAATTRGPGIGFTMDGGSLGQWFDVIVHRQEVTPADPA